MPQSITIGTRGSVLARWQTDYVSQRLRDAWPKLEVHIQVITTQGDRVLDTPLPLLGGKGVFTAELETNLHSGKIDLAVHSLKDLPTENLVGLTVGAIPQRAIANDVLVSKRSYTLATLPQNATVGTSSRRRAAQLLHKRPDLQIVDIRGNIDTRIRKALDPDGVYDAIVLASAGLERLGQNQVISDVLSLDDMMPAPGQGALAVQCRDEKLSRSLLTPINHAETEMAVVAERAFLGGLGGGCALPIAAYATIEGETLHLQGRVNAVDGTQQVDVSLSGTANIESAVQMGHELAQIALGQGVAALLETVR
ncbi:MAG: hydroxymethylbilane synthase [Anaerolineae bacterium]|nr:hydroxymethylbilane synthase [Anaerolineae bacterium]